MIQGPTFPLSSRARRRAPSPIRELMPFLSIPGMIPLSGGYPNPATFAFARVEAELTGLDGAPGPTLTLAGADLAAATQYGPTPGLPALVELLRGWQAHKDGVELGPGELLLLTGSQEGLYIAADLLLDEDDEVIVDEPTYPGALAAFRSFTDRFVAVPLDGEGMRTDRLAELLELRRARGERLPRLVYTIPGGHNPGGVTLSEPRRRQLATLAERYDLLLLEDDPYQLLNLDPHTPRLPTLQSLAPGHVLRLDSFSKILCPGLRLGYVSGAAQLVQGFNLFKQAANLHTSSFDQALLLAYLRAEGFDGLLGRIAHNVELYRRNRDAMVDAAHRHLPAGVRFEIPEAGMFLWFELPTGCDADRMVASDARELGVVLVPGSAFSTQGGLKNCMRASYSLVDAPRIEEGMRRFGEMVRREQERLDG